MRTQTSLRARDWQKATRTTTSTSAVPPDAQRQWLPDTELPGYELLPIPLPDEPTYALEPEGSLVATLVRRSHPMSRRAVLYVHGWSDYFFQRHLADGVPARDIAATEAFWQRLGFHTVYRDASYLLQKREGAEVHFFHHAALDPYKCDHGAYLRPSDINALDAEWAALGLPSTGIPRLERASDKLANRKSGQHFGCHDLGRHNDSRWASHRQWRSRNGFKLRNDG